MSVRPPVCVIKILPVLLWGSVFSLCDMDLAASAQNETALSNLQAPINAISETEITFDRRSPTILISQVSGTTTPLFRPILRTGSRGAEVTELQAALKLLGYYDGAVNGVYEQGTATAVSQFQQAAGLTADGVVGPATWNRLFPPNPSIVGGSLGTVTTGSNSRPVPTSSTTNPSPSANNSSNPANVTLPILRLGMKGSAVTGLQERLRAIGVFRGTADGVFGPETEAAVKAAQRKLKIEPDGVVGPATWSALLR